MLVPTTTSLRDRLREVTTREILEAAEGVLAEQGVQGSSMAAIAQNAGVSVGTLYNYFVDKDQLLRSLFELRRQEMREQIEQVSVAHAAASFSVHLEALVRAILGLYDTKRNLFRISIENERFLSPTAPRLEGGGGASDADQASLSPMQVLANRFRAVVAKGVAEGVLKPAPAGLYEAILAGILRAVLSEMLSGEPRAMASQAPLILDTFLHGASLRGDL